jgi:hypothetical protein
MNRVEYGELRLEQRHTSEAEDILQSADPPIFKALKLNRQDATILDIRASQLGDLAEAAETLGHHSRARQMMRECLDVVSGMIRRDASVKNYITEYHKMLVLAKRLDVPTDLR